MLCFWNDLKFVKWDNAIVVVAQVAATGKYIISHFPRLVSDMLEVALDAVFGKLFAAIWKDAQHFPAVACGVVVESEAG
jgi:hypothetical protein